MKSENETQLLKTMSENIKQASIYEALLFNSIINFSLYQKQNHEICINLGTNFEQENIKEIQGDKNEVKPWKQPKYYIGKHFLLKRLNINSDNS